MNDDFEDIRSQLMERPSWVIVVLVGVSLHVGLILLYANVFGRSDWTVTYIALAAIAILTTLVGGKLGRVHGVGQWIGAGLLVGLMPYVVVLGLFFLILRLSIQSP